MEAHNDEEVLQDKRMAGRLENRDINQKAAGSIPGRAK